MINGGDRDTFKCWAAWDDVRLLGDVRVWPGCCVSIEKTWMTVHKIEVNIFQQVALSPLRSLKSFTLNLQMSSILVNLHRSTVRAPPKTFPLRLTTQTLTRCKLKEVKIKNPKQSTDLESPKFYFILNGIWVGLSGVIQCFELWRLKSFFIYFPCLTWKVDKIHLLTHWVNLVCCTFGTLR